MRKTFASALFVVLAMAVPASAQYIPTTVDGYWYRAQGNQMMMLHADNLGLIRQIQREGYRNLRGDLRWNDRYGAYGLPIGGGFYPMYDHQMRPMGRREATATYGAIGAGLGYGVSGNARGTVIGAGVGALIGLITHRGKNNQQRDNGVIVTPESSEQQPPQQQNVRWGADGIPVAVGTRPGSPASIAQSQPVWKVFRNRFENLEVRVHVVGDNPSEYTTVPAGEEVSLELPANAKIWAEVVVWKGSRQVPTQELGQRELPYHSGWVFFNPAKGEM